MQFKPAYHFLEFNAPLSSERADFFAASLAQNTKGTVVDFGCGWGNMLLRVLLNNPQLKAIGIEQSPKLIEQAEKAAASHSVLDRLQLICGNAASMLDQPADAAICIGSSQIWGPKVELHQPLDYAAALKALRKSVRRGSTVIYGEGIWNLPPTDAAIAPLAGRKDEFLFLPELLDLVNEHGFAPFEVQQATLDEWDHFESGHAAKYADWLSRHPADHPQAAEVRLQAQSKRNAYYRGYRGILGMAYLVLVAV